MGNNVTRKETETQKEAKLIKILSLIQNHLERDHSNIGPIKLAAARWERIKKAHHNAIKKALHQVHGNALVVKVLKQKVKKATDHLESRAAKLSSDYGIVSLSSSFH